MFLLLIIPVVLYYRRRRINPPALHVSGIEDADAFETSLALRFRWILPALKYTALILLILAMARPQWGTQKLNVKTEGVNIVLAVDISESMMALDFKRKGKIVNRLEAIKGVVNDFIQKRTGDRIGLVVFGSYAYTQLPLTRDYHTIASVLDRIEIGAAGPRTAIGDAIGISLKRLEDIESKSNIIILLTDGQSNSGEIDPETAGQIAKQKNVKIYTIGVGSRGKAPYLIHDPVFGDQYRYMVTNIDEETLKDIARQTGGMYFRADNTTSLEKIYEAIDSLEKTEVQIQSFADYKEYYMFLLIPAFTLIGCWILLSNTRYLSVP